MERVVLFLKVTISSDNYISANVTSEIDIRNQQEAVAAVKAISKALSTITAEP